MKIAILNDYLQLALKSADWSNIAKTCDITVFDRAIAADEAAATLKPFHIICTLRERMAMPRELIAQLPNLKMLAITGLYNRVLDVAAATERGIVVSFTELRGSYRKATCELSWGLIHAVARHISFDIQFFKNKCLRVIGGGVAVALTVASAAAIAQPKYPSKPIRLIVGFPPGGNADASARLMALRMGEALGTNVVVENRTGAGGSIAAHIASRAAPDGYTLLWSSPGALTINRILEQNLPYNADTAFTPVGRTFTFGNAMIVRGDSPLTTVAQLIAYAKEKPGVLQFGTQGVGSAGHLSAQMLQNLSGINMSHIPYKGGGELVTAVIAGETPVGFVSTLAAGSMKSRVRVLAVTTPQRDPSLPDVPSMQESGVRNYDASFWFGIMVPAGTSSAIVERLGKEMRNALADAEVVRLARSQGLIAAPSSAQDFAALIKADYEKWKKVMGRA